MENSRIIAFGDIHGCFKAATSAVKLAIKEKALAVFLGDYVDRGNNSIEVCCLLFALKIMYPGNIYLLSDTNTIILNNNLSIIYGDTLPINKDDYAIGSLFIMTTTGDLYIKKIINNNPSWCKVQLAN
jgi:hypothetical protein